MRAADGISRIVGVVPIVGSLVDAPGAVTARIRGRLAEDSGRRYANANLSRQLSSSLSLSFERPRISATSLIERNILRRSGDAIPLIFSFESFESPDGEGLGMRLRTL